MATPKRKNPVIEHMLEELTGRSTAILSDRCISKPLGCGGPATEFKNETSRREYKISGWCQRCQDRVYDV